MLKISKVIKFLVSGGIAALVEYGVYLAVLVCAPSLHLFFAQTTSFVCGFFVSFFMNKKWVFSVSKKKKYTLIKYSILAAVNLVIGNIGILLLSDLGLNILFAKLIVMITVAAWNYVIFSRLIFR